MSQYQPVENRRPWLAPLLVSLVLLLLIGIVIYLFHTGTHHPVSPAEGRLAELKQQRDALLTERQRLEGLLALPPCDALTRSTGAGLLPLSPVSQTSPSAGPAVEPVVPTKAKDAAELLERACVFIVSADNAGHVATGTGFFVSETQIVTNDHVVGTAQGRVLVTSKALGRPLAGTVVARDTSGGRDYALLKVAVPQDAAIAIPPFADGVKRTEKVGSWGFPHIIGQNDPAYKRLLSGEDMSAVPELTYTEGVVSALLERTPPLLVHTAPISPGNSGGPLVNANGQIVGINTMITLDEDSYRQASIALDVQDLRKFLAAQGIRR